MPSKKRKLSFFDLPATATGGAGATNTVDDVAAPPAVQVGAPQNVALTTDVIYASAAPQSYIAIDFDPPDTNTGATPDRYTIQVSTNVTFTASGTITMTVAPEDPDAPLVRVDGLPPNTLHYVRLRAIVNGFPGAWTSMSPLTTGVNRITTAADTTAAGVPTSITATWIGYGDLLVTWTNPTEANLKDVKIVVRASSGGTIYRTTYSAAQRFLYPLAWNYQDTSGAGDSSLYVELTSRTFSNVLGTTVNTGLVTKSAPAAPSGISHTWSGDTGTAGADWAVSWTRAEDAYRYRLTIDGAARQLADADTYTYAFALNKSEHSGTPDPVLSYSLVAIDGFGQASTAASGTATNAAPPTPTVSLAQGGFMIVATVGGTQAADFEAYEYVWKRDSTTVRTLESAAKEQQYELSGASDDGYHSWTVVVRQKDRFGQYSSTVTSSAVAFEALTLAGLRARISYTDSISTSTSTLKTAMSDDVRDSGGVSYAA